MQCDTMRPETGSGCRTSPSSHTSPFLASISCSSCMMWAVPEGQGEGMSWPHYHNCSNQIKHPPSMLTPCLPTTTVIIVAIPTPCISAQPMGQSCYNSSAISHYTALCKQQEDPASANATIPGEVTTMVEATEVQEAPGATNHPSSSNRSRHRGQCSSHSPGRQSCHCSSSCTQSGSPFPQSLPQCISPIGLTDLVPECSLFWYSQDSLEIIPAWHCWNLISPWRFPADWDSIWHDQVSFYTRLQLPMKEWYQADDHEDLTLVVRWTPPPWAGTGSLFPQNLLMRPGTLSPIPPAQQPKPGSLHDGKPKPFPVHFVAEVQQCHTPYIIPCLLLCVSQDATSLPQILLSFALLQRG